jgi:hypothetical protein
MQLREKRHCAKFGRVVSFNFLRMTPTSSGEVARKKIIAVRALKCCCFDRDSETICKQINCKSLCGQFLSHILDKELLLGRS